MPSNAAHDPLSCILASAPDLTPSRLREAVVQGITDAILSGALGPGDPLPAEGRIAEAFGVSKPIAREAIRELTAMGVVHSQQGKATRVRALDAEPLGRIFRFAIGRSETGLAQAVEVRRALEPTLARFAAQRRTDAQLADMQEVLRRLKDALGDIPAWIEADLDFHACVAQMTGNRLFQLQMEGLRPVIREIMVLFNSRDARGPSDWRATYARHARVAEAVEAGDGERAFAAMERHFEAAEVAMRELFPEDGSARSGGNDDAHGR